MAKASQPLGRGWTVGKIPDQTGRRAIVTGANIGIGYGTALELARRGAVVVLASRDLKKAEDAAGRIRASVPGAAVRISQLDLASLPSVRSFAARELAQAEPLDLLINNAGVYAPPRRLETSDGFELQFGTNVLGHFALTGLLLPRLSQSLAPNPRVVYVASIAHKRGRIRFDDLQARASYSPTRSYTQSKLADLMLALELDRRLRAVGSRVQSIAAHPGVANTNLFKAGTYSRFEATVRQGAGHVIAALLNSDTEGALPTLFAATATEAEPGCYYGPQGFAEMRGGDVGPARIAPHAQNAEVAARLWRTCEELTGVSVLSNQDDSSAAPGSSGDTGA